MYHQISNEQENTEQHFNDFVRQEPHKNSAFHRLTGGVIRT